MARPLKDGAPRYSTIHGRLRWERGPASDFDCISCSKPAEDWAYCGPLPAEHVGPKGPFSTNLSHYLPMCRGCHVLQDKPWAATACVRGHERVPENRMWKDGRDRGCRVCSRDRAREHSRMKTLRRQSAQ